MQDFYGDARPWNEANTTALSIITIIGLSLSILGLALTVITFIFFKSVTLFFYRLDDLVVTASASRAEDPGFESRLRREFSGVESYQ